MMKVTSTKDIAKDLLAKIGYRTINHIVVFESDDWGAIRNPDQESLAAFQIKYPGYDLDRYQLYDGLEKLSDVIDLSNLLLSYNNQFSKGPVFTFNYATANPVFKECSFSNGEYIFGLESVEETYKNYGDDVLEFIRKGIDSVNIRPQLHGREHINLFLWLHDCATQEESRYAFELGILGINNKDKYASMDVLNRNNILIDRKDYIKEAQRNFKHIFGFSSDSFIAPCYVADSVCEEAAAEEGIRVIQTSQRRNIPRTDGTRKRVLTIFGGKTPYNQVRLVRNCQFEPTQAYFKNKMVDECVEQAVKDIEAAFYRKQPAILCTHRVNYSSRVEQSHKDYSLEALDKLLSILAKKYPDTLFMTSDELGLRILDEK